MITNPNPPPLEPPPLRVTLEQNSDGNLALALFWPYPGPVWFRDYYGTLCPVIVQVGYSLAIRYGYPPWVQFILLCDDALLMLWCYDAMMLLQLMPSHCHRFCFFSGTSASSLGLRQVRHIRRGHQRHHLVFGKGGKVEFLGGKFNSGTSRFKSPILGWTTKSLIFGWKSSIFADSQK